MMRRAKSPSVITVIPSTPVHGRRNRTPNERGDEAGAILILALAYLVLVSLVVALLSTWVSNNLNNSANFTAANSMTVAASGMTDLAIQYVRYNPLISDSTTVELPTPFIPCWGGTSVTAIQAIDGDQVAVWCSTEWNPLVAQTRTVTFDACPIAVAKNTCIATPAPGQPPNWLLTATVVFDDYPPAPAKSAPIQTLCTVYCGEGMTIVNWQWGSSTAGSATTGVAASMSFTNEPSDTNALTSTQAAVTVLDASSNPVAGDTVTIVQQSGPSCGTPLAPGVSSPTSTVTAITDSDGIAEFTDIVPQCPGAYTLTAVDGSVNATSSSFQVAEPRSVITTSTAPTNATQGGTYQVSATASSGDVPPALAIADTASATVCTMSGTYLVTFKGPGTCTITFNDLAPPANFAPALQVTQSFQVGGQTATQVGIVLATKTPNASGTTNDSVTVTLENAVGATVTSTGVTTLVLSDTGSGFFALGTGTTGASTYNLGIPNGVSSGTVYFGGQNTGPDSISAVNGTTVWGTTSLTIVSGTPTQVAITPSTPTPGVSATTNTTLSFQLEDAFGNIAASATPITLTLSAGSGFFAATSGASGSSTYSVNFAANVGSATAYFGDQTSGADVVTAKNGTTTWGTSTLTLAPGAASKVLVTLSPTNPVIHTTTNVTVSLQLEDQFDNAVPLAGVAFTLSNSGAGFFSKTTGNAGTPTLTLSGNGAGGVTSASGATTAAFGDNTTQSVTITATGTGTYSGISSTSTPLND